MDLSIFTFVEKLNVEESPILHGLPHWPTKLEG